MSRIYFGNIDVKSFDFIEFQESYSDDLQLLSQLLSIPIKESKENVNTFTNYEEEINAIKENKQGVLNILYDCLAEDIIFYENAQKISREIRQKFI